VITKGNAAAPRRTCVSRLHDKNDFTPISMITFPVIRKTTQQGD
jgi:hypothetical protein